MAHQPAAQVGSIQATREPIVGIDLGTTNSLVAIYAPEGPRVLVDREGHALVPSVVRFEGDARVVVGRGAKASAAEFPASTIASVKRLMGRSLADASKDIAFLAYRVVAGERGTARVRVPSESGPPRELSPEEVSAHILAELKRLAEDSLGHEVRRVVVTVPAYFDDAQRQATRVAAQLAGLDAVRIVPEPTAAALAYGVGLWRSGGSRTERHVCVYDLGGGTFDVSILRISPAVDAGESDFYEVLAIGGDTRLGGDDADHLLMGLFAREIGALDGRDEHAILGDASVRARLRDAAEGAKIALSGAEVTRVRVEAALRQPGASAYERELSRREFEALISPLVDRTLGHCAGALRDARAKGLGAATPDAPAHGLDAVILVGGSTRIPLVRERVGAFFGIEPYVALDPERVVALGASVQGAILSGAMGGSLLLDALPLSLGIETAGGAVAKIIHRNSTVPCGATEMFSTQVDGQRSIRLTVYQGEREMASDCRKLGEFHLAGLPPMPAGVARVEVEFLVDASGVLSVRAHERRSGKRARMQVVPNHGLTSEEVARIERDSVLHAREDMRRHRVADLVANARLDARWISQKLGAHRAALDPSYAGELEARLASLDAMVASAQRDWRSVDADALHRAKEDLDRASVRLQEVAIAHALREAGARPE
jgi:molecular chaperone DnaK (HSP70)